MENFKVGDLVVNLRKRTIPEGHPVQENPHYVPKMDLITWGQIIREHQNGCFAVKPCNPSKASRTNWVSQTNWIFHPSWIAPMDSQNCPEEFSELLEKELIHLLKEVAHGNDQRRGL